jgi:hypothetical protein
MNDKNNNRNSSDKTLPFDKSSPQGIMNAYQHCTNISQKRYSELYHIGAVNACNEQVNFNINFGRASWKFTTISGSFLGLQ